ncbi:hypothetical protein EVAR_83102_1 [Eumeta japonica]|uniref:Uncharacterized protein n=1 Tax=Eumeta variegata TaxID=151549 RepID=A0A4C1WLT6_EUMVA|nr:hypothetical protein EVAR_83102_1 [Eumeta japonica]
MVVREEVAAKWAIAIMTFQCCARGRPIIVEWERDARHSAGLSLVRGGAGRPRQGATSRERTRSRDRCIKRVHTSVSWHRPFQICKMADSNIRRKKNESGEEQVTWLVESIIVGEKRFMNSDHEVDLPTGAAFREVYRRFGEGCEPIRSLLVEDHTSWKYMERTLSALVNFQRLKQMNDTKT